MECTNCKKLKSDLEWAAEKLISFRTRFGNAGFSTNDLDRLFNILGSSKFFKASEPKVSREGVWGT